MSVLLPMPALVLDVTEVTVNAQLTFSSRSVNVTVNVAVNVAKSLALPAFARLRLEKLKNHEIF